MRLPVGAFSLVFFVLGAIACSSSTPSSASLTTTSDAGSDDDAAAVHPTEYPAFRPSAPQMKSSGGPVLTTPRIVPIFFAGDPDRTKLADFVAKLPQSSYWKTVTAPYGIGATTTASPIVIDDEPAPTQIGDPTIQKWLATHLDGTHAAWGDPDPNAIYAVFYPSGTTFDIQGSVSCKDLGGYHSFTKIAGTGVAYAIVGRCPKFAGMVGIDVATAGASHELMEAAANPSYYENSAFGAVDDDHIAWELEPGAEVGDMCDRFSGVYFKPDDLGFTVERMWSNESAAAGHHPCIPTLPGEVYFNAIPMLNESVAMTAGRNSVKTKGIRVPVGTEKTIDVALLSDAPTDEWVVAAETVMEQSPSLEFSFDGAPTAKGKNGDVLELTIKTKAKSTFAGGVVFKLTSTLGDKRNFWVGFVQN